MYQLTEINGLIKWNLMNKQPDWFKKKSSNLKILNKTKRYEFEIEISKVLACAM